MPAIQDSGIANLYDRVSKKSTDFYARWGHYPDRLLISVEAADALKRVTLTAAVSDADLRNGAFEFLGMRVLVAQTPGILEVFRVA